jgi:hypothetical protein
MNPNVKEKWLNALRSDEYSQTRGVLMNEGGFCCLGVLCDIYSKEQNVPWDSERRIFGKGGEVPTEIQLWAGFVEENPEKMHEEDDDYIETVSNPGNPKVNHKPEYSSFTSSIALSVLNDDIGLSFAEIADLIEKQM